MLRLTREGQPNLFIYKHQIRTISEAGKRRTTRYATPSELPRAVVPAPPEEAS
jgi:host factor-I protein